MGKRSRETEEEERNEERKDKSQEKRNKIEWESQKKGKGKKGRERGAYLYARKEKERKEGRGEDKSICRMLSGCSHLHSRIYCFSAPDVANFSLCYLWFWGDQRGEKENTIVEGGDSGSW